ncbi:uncharacterized protein J3D65DRAFT_237473 [Phyllosticta citribraziliensis]|uniref:Uncharacterized protein n=1 Tax=Phyllosticta citribraziliensis TaxID=989973 RepID=A0ABR1M0R7_9PEZI
MHSHLLRSLSSFLFSSSSLSLFNSFPFWKSILLCLSFFQCVSHLRASQKTQPVRVQPETFDNLNRHELQHLGSKVAHLNQEKDNRADFVGQSRYSGAEHASPLAAHLLASRGRFQPTSTAAAVAEWAARGAATTAITAETERHGLRAWRVGSFATS